LKSIINRLLTPSMLALALCCPAAKAAAQGITGQVLDANTMMPVPTAEVSLLDAERQPLHSVVADSAGAFTLRVPRTGRYHLRAERIGYEAVTSSPMDLSVKDTAAVVLRMSVHVVVLAPLTVSSGRPLHNRALDDFYERRKFAATGRSAFFAPEDIERFPLTTVTALLESAPGVRVRVSYDGGLPQVQMRRNDRLCVPMIMVDGSIMAPDFRDDDLNSRVQSQSLRAVEIYEGLAVPAELYLRPWAGCGVIVIWTSHTVDRGRR
jgi:hypothetical protein